MAVRGKPAAIGNPPLSAKNKPRRRARKVGRARTPSLHPGPGPSRRHHAAPSRSADNGGWKAAKTGGAQLATGQENVRPCKHQNGRRIIAARIRRSDSGEKLAGQNSAVTKANRHPVLRTGKEIQHQGPMVIKMPQGGRAVHWLGPAARSHLPGYPAGIGRQFLGGRAPLLRRPSAITRWRVTSFFGLMCMFMGGRQGPARRCPSGRRIWSCTFTGRIWGIQPGPSARTEQQRPAGSRPKGQRPAQAAASGRRTSFSKRPHSAFSTSPKRGKQRICSGGGRAEKAGQTGPRPSTRPVIVLPAVVLAKTAPIFRVAWRRRRPARQILPPDFHLAFIRGRVQAQDAFPVFPWVLPAPLGAPGRPKISPAAIIKAEPRDPPAPRRKRATQVFAGGMTPGQFRGPFFFFLPGLARCSSGVRPRLFAKKAVQGRRVLLDRRGMDSGGGLPLTRAVLRSCHGCK